MPLFEFELTPLDEVSPWGGPSNFILHWFGLSLGHYFIDVRAARLLEYHSEPRYFEYQVARVHEDLLSMLPDVRDAIPAHVAELFCDGSLGSTLRELKNLWKEIEYEDEDLDDATMVLERRALDTGYLRKSPGIWIWTSGETVVIEWDNRDQLWEGKPVWSADQGQLELTSEDFLNEIFSFHRRFIFEMTQRVEEVSRNWRRPEIQIDVEQLQKECIERADWNDWGLRRPVGERDWYKIAAAVKKYVPRNST